jgi:hypothetical protein
MELCVPIIAEYMNYYFKRPMLLVVLVLLFSCNKEGKPLELDTFMSVDVRVYHPDTSVYHIINLGGQEVKKGAQYISGSGTTYIGQIQTTYRDSAELDIKLIKTQENSKFEYKKKTGFSFINNYLLFQTCTDATPILINIGEGEKTEPPPAGDSIKLRFFFSNNDKLINPNPSQGKLIRRMRLQIFTFTNNSNINLPPPAASFIAVYNAVDFDMCDFSPYVTLAKNKHYGFRVRDISPGVSSAASANLVQQLLIGDVQLVNDDAGVSSWDFKRGKIFVDREPTSRFQTIRIKTSDILYVDAAGNDVTERSINGLFTVGLK